METNAPNAAGTTHLEVTEGLVFAVASLQAAVPLEGKVRIQTEFVKQRQTSAGFVLTGVKASLDEGEWGQN